MLQRSLAPSMFLVALAAILLILLAFAPSALAARNPSGTGQPSVECNEGSVTESPPGFTQTASRMPRQSTQATASHRTPATITRAQYDVACYS